jgi:adenosine deaminase
VRAIEDPALVTRLARDGVALNICLSSNLIHLYPTEESHPFKRLHEAGVKMTINTDDPGYIGVDLAGELTKAAALMGWGVAELADVTRVAIDASFAPATTKARLHDAVDAFVAGPSRPSRPTGPTGPTAWAAS